MEGERRKLRRLPWAAVVLLVLPPLYVLSAGPAARAWELGWMSTEVLERGWRPALELGRIPLVGPAVTWHVGLWSEWAALSISPPPPPPYYGPSGP